jgi:PAS domain S-box-containing protein
MTRNDTSWREAQAFDAEHGDGDPFAAAVRATRMPMLITDPRKPDNPVIFANEAFSALTGYPREEVVGRNCRFLQGAETDRETVALVRQAIEARTPISADVLNYRKDGSPFWNALYISPVFDDRGELVYFFASQYDATSRLRHFESIQSERRKLEDEVKRRTVELSQALARQTEILQSKDRLLHELDHRVKNNLQTVAALVALQMRKASDQPTRGVLKSILDRVEALGAVHRCLFRNEDIASFDLREFVALLSHETGQGEHRARVTIEQSPGPVMLSVHCASAVALVINEVLGSAIRCCDASPSLISLRLDRAGQNATIVVTSRCADEGHHPALEPGSLLIAQALVNQLRGRLSMSSEDCLVRITVEIPLESSQ